MKKNILIIICIVVIAVLVLGGVTIGMTRNKSKDSGNIESNKPESIEIDDESENDDTNSNNTNDDSKILVVYYSASGNTKRVAEKIAKNLNADIFEIEPKEEYTSDDLDWTNDKSRVTVEHEDESKRKVELKSTTVENWNSYDTILIGYPIWWGIAAWPTNSFVKANDFTGKTVYTFATSVSSGLGSSTSLLEKDAKGGNWKDGKRFSGIASDDEIKKWTDSLK